MEDRFVCVDFALSGVSQFPSTAEKAQAVWTDYLNQQAARGLLFVQTFKYALGADLNRRMVVFERVQKGETSSK